MTTEANGSAPKRRKVAEPAKFRPGFIRTVKVWNFTTYSYTEFSLSPTLNMIIGPNGSGKSTLVASICIGLAGSISLIKRKNLKSMIKTGQEKAVVEITLENNEGKAPIVVKREFTAKDSIWTINGQRSTETKVRNLRSKFNIQLDNLCHFLPQERVAEFAGLSPEKLLMETERTLGDGHLLRMHEELISHDNESQVFSNKIDDLKTRLGKLQNEKDQLEEAAKRFEEYENKAEDIANHTLLIPYARFQDLKKQRAHLKAAREKAKQKLQSFQANFKPLNDAISETESQIEQESQEFEEIKRSARSFDESIDQFKKTQTQCSSDIVDLILNAKSTRTKAEEKRKELEAAKQEIEHLQQQKDSLPQVDEEKLKEWAEEVSTKRHELRDLEEKYATERGLKQDASSEVRQLQEKKRAAEHTLQSKDKLDVLLSAARQGPRLRLRDEALDAHKKLRTIPEYGERYFEAPVISCNVTDPSYAPAMEKVIDNNSLFAFTATSQENLNFLTQFSEKTGINAPLRMVNSAVNASPAYSKDELRSFGFDGYLSDFITGPKEVLSMIYNTSKLHTIPVSRRTLSDAQVKRLTEPQPSGKVAFMKFVAGDTLYNIQRSRYGSRQSFYVTEKISNSQFFGVQGMSQEAKDSIKREIEQLAEREAEKKEVYERHRIAADAIGRQCSEIKSQIAAIKGQQQEMDNRVKKAESLRIKIEMKKERAVKLERDANKDYSQKVHALERKIQQKFETFGEASASICSALIQMAQRDNEARLKRMNVINLKNRKSTAESLLRELKEMQEELRKDYQRYKSEYDEIKRSDAYVEIERQNQAYTDEERMRLAGMAEAYVNNGTFTEATILLKIELLKDELSLLTRGDEGTIGRLKTKLQDIKDAERFLPELEKKKEQLDKQISDLQEKYEGELSVLVDKISLAFNKRFTKVASDGRVQLAKLTRFKDWKLQILVKFREESELKVLDHQSQSGGERAVSTIFFIMSLQGLTDAPFRIVDEINQGMDPKNEQMAHRYLVHTACQNNRSQYFLVTPKLLTGLYYHPDMVVHCIFTGPYITDDNKDQLTLNFAV
ncbi:Structural maintenance of chromosomes protein 5 [Candida viswanathii]|uniref:Structural maintenance of chromosomes protein 5 n=1 Tax=Candida viswanathii TaxID=5486 RepID=A0A367XZG4_9ASCO|nr:Structural maintenance of chromosomes protein 5 [Candida viswanathii]